MIDLKDMDPGRDILVFDEKHDRALGGVRFGVGKATIHEHDDFPMHSHPGLIIEGRRPLVVGEQPVRVEGLGLGLVLVAPDQDGVVEVFVPEHGVHRVRAAIVHRGHTQWVDDD